MPIRSPWVSVLGPHGAAWQEQERVVTLGFLSVGVAFVLCSLLVLWGLRGKVRCQDGRRIRYVGAGLQSAARESTKKPPHS